MSILYIVSTPIGNLKDLTFRALEVLQQVDWIAVEDTRVSSKLLRHYGVKKKLLSYHKYNEFKQMDKFVALLQSGKKGALISDAGTPLISDPGYLLVSNLVKLGIQVVSIPGASALTAALSIAGIPTDRFIFEGFLPNKKLKKRNYLSKLKSEGRTLVFYEAPHRLKDTLEALVTVFSPERTAVLARELTKMHEEIVRGSLSDLSRWAERQKTILGELVIIVSGTTIGSILDQDLKEMLKLLLSEVSLKLAVELVVKLTKIERSRVYHLACMLKRD